MPAAVAARIAAGDVKGIFHAIQETPGCGGLALRVTRVAAVRQGRVLVALEAIRIFGTDRMGRRSAGGRAHYRQTTHGQQSQNHPTHTHQNLPSAAAAVSRIRLR